MNVATVSNSSNQLQGTIQWTNIRHTTVNIQWTRTPKDPLHSHYVGLPGDEEQAAAVPQHLLPQQQRELHREHGHTTTQETQQQPPGWGDIRASNVVSIDFKPPIVSYDL